MKKINLKIGKVQKHKKGEINMFGKKIETKVMIEGMHCEHCANKVKQSLESIDGVKKVSVSLKDKCATITSKEEIDKKEIEDEITSLDYKIISMI